MNIKEELKKNKVYIIILIIILILYVVLAIIGTSSKGNNQKVDGYLIVGDSLIYQKVGDKWEQLGEVPNISDLKFTVYDGNDRIENVKIQYNSNKLYFFDNDYNELKLDDYRIAYTDNIDVSLDTNRIQNYEESDDEYIKEVTKINEGYSLQSYRNSLKKLDIDYDGDGEEEILYTITNFSYEVTDYAMMSYLFVVDNGEVTVIDSAEGLSPFTIIDSLDLNNDGKFEVIVANEIINESAFDSCYQIYGIKDSKFALLQDCEVQNNGNS